MSAIRVELELADGTFTTRLLSAGQSVENFTKQVENSSPALQALAASGTPVIKSMNLAEKASRSFLSVLREISIVTGLFSYGLSKITSLNDGWIGSIIKTNTEMERLSYQMQAMSTSTDPLREAADAIDFLKKKSLEAPFAFNTMTDAFVKMKATGIDPLNGSLQALTDGVAAAGGDDESLKRAVLAVSQISGKGVLQMEELRQQLGESMPQAAALMARSMGVSMSQMISEISSGTVAAKPALESLFNELDRTYGGRAQMMMRSFAGQIQRTKTLFQQLAVGGTIKSEFFDGALRQQVEDLNAFLTSDAAGKFRDSFGNALASTVLGFRSVIDTAIQFRSELGRIGLALAGVFTVRGLAIGISSLSEGFSKMKKSAEAAKLAAEVASSKWAEFDAIATTSASGWAKSKQAVSAFSATLGSAIQMIGAWAPLIAGVGIAVYAAGEYFGLFSNKVEEAFLNLEKFGAESKRQAEEVVGLYEKQLNARKSAIEAAMSAGADGWDDELARVEKELANFHSRVGKIIGNASQSEMTAAVKSVSDTTDRLLEESRAKYETSMLKMTESSDKLEQEAAKSGESVERVKRERAIETFNIQKKLYDDQIASIQGVLNFQKEVLNYAVDDQSVKNANAVITDLQKKLTDLYGKRNALQIPELVHTTKLTDEDKALARGQKYAENLKAEIAGLEEELAGGAKKAAEIDNLIKQKRFGSLELPQVQQLRDEIVAGEKQADILREKIRLKKEEQRLYDNGKDAAEKMRSEIEGFKSELAGGNFNIAELQKALELGKVGDVDSENVRKLIAELNELMATREKLKAQAKALRESNQLFENGQENLRNITAEIKGMLGELEGVNAKVAEMNELLASGKYGDQDQERVQALREALLDAIDAKEKLDKLMDAKRDLERDTESALEKSKLDLVEAQIAATGRVMGESEKVLFKLDNGFYKGFGKGSESEQALRDIAEAMAHQGIAADALAIAMRENTFGQRTVAQINTVTEAVKQLSGEIANIGRAVQGVSFENFNVKFNASNLSESITASVEPVFEKLPQQMSDRMTMAMDYLMKNGISRNAAAGLVGNFAVESNMNPGAIQPGKGAIGLAQWDDRRDALKAYLSSRGLAWNDFYGQLDFAIKELRTTEKKAGSRLQLASDARSASDIAMREYERPAALSIAKTAGKRAGYSMQAYDLAGKSLGPLNSTVIYGDQEVAKNYQGPTINNGAGYQIRNNSITNQTSNTAPAQNLPATLPALKITEADLAPARSFQEIYEKSLETLKKSTAETEKKTRAKLAESSANEKEAQQINFATEQKTVLDELIAKSKNADRSLDELGKNHQAILEKIREGKLGPSKDEAAPEYRKIIEAAKDLDKVESDIATKKKSKRDADTANERFLIRQQELAKQAEEAVKRLANPNLPETSSGYRTLERELQLYVEDVKRAYGETSQATRQAEEFKASTLRQFRNTEILETTAANSKKTQDLQRSFLTESERRRLALEEEIQRIDQEVSAFQGSEEEKVQLVAAAEARKAALRRQAAEADSPLTKQMREWGDLQNNLAEASTRWMDNLAGGISDLIMGTGDLRSAIQGIMKDIVNMGVKYLMSGMGSKSAQVTNKGGNKAGSAARKGTSKLATGGKSGKLAPHFDGGLVGERTPGRMKRALAAVNGFDSGGYTGDGGKYEPAGIVHRGEYVMPKFATKVIGVENLRMLHRRAMNGRLTRDKVSRLSVFNDRQRTSLREVSNTSTTLLEGFAEGGLVGGGVSSSQAPIAAASRASVHKSVEKAGKNATAGNNITINNSPTINATGGTPQQNEDVARRTAKEMEGVMRGVVVDEIIRQMRPGNILNQGRYPGR